MVVGGRYDGGGGPLDFSFSLFQMFVNLKSFILVICSEKMRFI